jgi:transposase
LYLLDIVVRDFHASEFVFNRRRLTRYMRRWLVERFFAWMQWQRRILIRWEYHTQNFLGFVQLACLVILFR